MWVKLARGNFIYGTHMTRSITTNNMTNTQTLVQCAEHFPTHTCNKKGRKRRKKNVT